VAHAEDPGDLDPIQQSEHWQLRASAAQSKAAHAYERLLSLAERSDTGQARVIAQFLASTYNGQSFPFDLFDLRVVDVAIGDDMLACLDALRWAKADLFKLVPDGDRRVRAVIDDWGLKWPGED
jgi:hypothetical protein